MITIALDLCAAVICVRRFAHVSPAAKEACARLEAIKTRILKIARVNAESEESAATVLTATRMRQVARAYLVRAIADLEGTVSEELFNEAAELLESGIDCIDTVAREAAPDSAINSHGGMA